MAPIRRGGVYVRGEKGLRGDARLQAGTEGPKCRLALSDISCARRESGHQERHWFDEMPSFRIRLLSVFGGSPTIAAAPFAPPTTPPVVFKTEMM